MAAYEHPELTTSPGTSKLIIQLFSEQLSLRMTQRLIENIFYNCKEETTTR